MSAGVFVSATLDIGDVEKGLAAMQRRARVLGPAFRELRTPLRLDQRDHSKQRQGPSGMWAPRAASTLGRRGGTVRHKIALGRRATRPMGRLPGAVTYSSDGSGVRGTSRVLWSGVHQDGGTVGRGARLPARPFLWISDDMLRIAEDTLGSALVRAYGGH